MTAEPNTPFDEAIAAIKKRGYHNHRLEEHSNLVSNGIFADLLAGCPPLRDDHEAGAVRSWTNVRAPGARKRKIDLFVGEALDDGKPNVSSLRICVENKSVITAHRNRDARFDDLNETMKVVHAVRQEAVIVATVLVGVAERVLNVPDKVKPPFKGKPAEFAGTIVRRLSSGDGSLWTEYAWAVSKNTAKDPQQTIDKLRQLPTRSPAHTHVEGYDYVLFVPVYIDNVNPPRVARDNALGVDVDARYQEMLSVVCKAYSARWHL
jgi:hypothetical protein